MLMLHHDRATHSWLCCCAYLQAEGCLALTARHIKMSACPHTHNDSAIVLMFSRYIYMFIIFMCWHINRQLRLMWMSFISSCLVTNSVGQILILPIQNTHNMNNRLQNCVSVEIWFGSKVCSLNKRQSVTWLDSHIISIEGWKLGLQCFLCRHTVMS